MQLVIDIENKDMADKIIKLLNIFKNDGISIKSISNEKNQIAQEFDVDYEKSFQYKLDRAEFNEMKESLWIIFLTTM